MRHLLVTNDFPPKVGGIQSYLWELWRRLPPEDVVVYTTPYAGTAEFDAAQAFRIIRSKAPVLLPHPGLAGRIDRLADEVGAELVVCDPALPLGLVAPALRHPYGVVLHGAEVTVPGRLPGTQAMLARVLRRASLVIAAGGYPAAEARRAARRPDLAVTVVPPGVDVERFAPLTPPERAAARQRFGLPLEGRVITGVSRLVPRKGFDVVLSASARLASSRPDLVVAIAGAGRDRARLEQHAGRVGAPARFLGRLPDDDLAAFYGCGDIFAMVCRNRWGGLEQEGFGIVYLEAAAAGVPQVAGASGGAAEAVADGETGIVVAQPRDVGAVAEALAALLDDGPRRAAMAAAGRARAVEQFTYDVVAARLGGALGVGA
jgi:phosphatidylinositol alpha-1,6-mannosyltransferase